MLGRSPKCLHHPRLKYKTYMPTSKGESLRTRVEFDRSVGKHKLSSVKGVSSEKGGWVGTVGCKGKVCRH